MEFVFRATGSGRRRTRPVGASMVARRRRAARSLPSRGRIRRLRGDQRTGSTSAAGAAIEQQVMAANVDTIFLVTAAMRDLNPRRLERYLTTVWDAGAVPVVVLNKADLTEDPERACDDLRSRLPLVDVVAVSALGLAARATVEDALSPYLRRAETIALLGSSGVGKSTIVNRLIGHDVRKVGAIRESDGRGRHTTTARHLVELPSGALLIDTPGMRELVPWTQSGSVDGASSRIPGVS